MTKQQQKAWLGLKRTSEPANCLCLWKFSQSFPFADDKNVICMKSEHLQHSQAWQTPETNIQTLVWTLGHPASLGSVWMTSKGQQGHSTQDALWQHTHDPVPPPGGRGQWAGLKQSGALERRG